MPSLLNYTYDSYYWFICVCVRACVRACVRTCVYVCNVLLDINGSYYKCIGMVLCMVPIIRTIIPIILMITSLSQ